MLYDEFSAFMKSFPDITTRVLAIGLSRSHDAVQMNSIANFGNEIGNFIFVDTHKEAW